MKLLCVLYEMHQLLHLKFYIIIRDAKHLYTSRYRLVLSMQKCIKIGIQLVCK